MMIRKITKKIKFIILGSALMPAVFVVSSSDTSEDISKVPAPGFWYKVPGLSIKDGSKGAFLKTKNGDLYVLTKGKGLKVSRDNGATFGDVNIANLTDGEGGTIFQAKDDAIYVMGKGIGLKVSRDNGATFVDVNIVGLTSSENGSIFQTKDDAIYVMGKGIGLKVSRNNGATFVDVNIVGLIDGEGGTIFQAKDDAIYVMGKGIGLKVSRDNGTTFGDVNIFDLTSSENGKIFEAKNGNLYLIRTSGEPLVSKDNGLSFNLIENSPFFGNSGLIWQDENGDLYMMGNRHQKVGPLGTGDSIAFLTKVIKNGQENLTNFNFRNKGLNELRDIEDATIFQAKNGDTYLMARNIGLMVLKNNGIYPLVVGKLFIFLFFLMMVRDIYWPF